MKINIFLQSEMLDDIELVEVAANSTPKDVVAACISRLPSHANEKEFLLFVEDEDDAEHIDNLTTIPDGLRVHLHRMKGIDVQVRYAGRDVRRSFRPSTTIGRIKIWATAELGISGPDAAELMLQIAGTDVRPDLDTHVGALVKSPDHAIAFDLVPAPRVNG